MASKPGDRSGGANPSNNNKPKKVNLGELKGQLNKRGRSRYNDPEVRAHMETLLATGEPVAYGGLYDATDLSETEIVNIRAKWRNRFTSVVASIDPNRKVSVHWTTEHEVVITLAKS